MFNFDVLVDAGSVDLGYGWTVTKLSLEHEKNILASSIVIVLELVKPWLGTVNINIPVTGSYETFVGVFCPAPVTLIAFVNADTNDAHNQDLEQ